MSPYALMDKMAMWALLFTVVLAGELAAHAGDDGKASSARAAPQPYSPPIAPASDQAQRAIRSFRVPAGLKVELFAAEPLLANPVAFCVDEKGVVYVAETFRLQRGRNRHARAT